MLDLLQDAEDNGIVECEICFTEGLPCQDKSGEVAFWS